MKPLLFGSDGADQVYKESRQCQRVFHAYVSRTVLPSLEHITMFLPKNERDAQEAVAALLCRSSSNLRELRLVQWEFAAGPPTSFEEVWEDLFQGFGVFPCLTYLDIGHMEFGPAGWAALAALLQRNGFLRLKRLRIHGTNDGAGVTAVFRALQRCHKMEVLVLTSCV